MPKEEDNELRALLQELEQVSSELVKREGRLAAINTELESVLLKLQRTSGNAAVLYGDVRVLQDQQRHRKELREHSEKLIEKRKEIEQELQRARDRLKLVQADMHNLVPPLAR